MQSVPPPKKIPSDFFLDEKDTNDFGQRVSSSLQSDVSSKDGKRLPQEPEERSKLALLAISILLAILVIVLVVALVGISNTGNDQIVPVAAQEEEIEDANDDDQLIKKPTTDVVNLVNLIGLTQQEVLDEIGHGAEVVSSRPSPRKNSETVVVVGLGSEPGSIQEGTPQVTLYLDQDNKTQAAGYTASLALLGFENLSFVDALGFGDCIGFLLKEVGLTNNTPISIPDSEDYSQYTSDGKTLTHETYTFNGLGSTSDNQPYYWQSRLDYDYTLANASGNLADTMRFIDVVIERAPSQ